MAFIFYIVTCNKIGRWKTLANVVRNLCVA